MLAHVWKGIQLPVPFYVQPKLNGVRALYQAGSMWSRDEVRWNDPIVEHITSELRQIVPPEWILDGELYHHGWSLQQINSAVAVKRLEPTLRTREVSYFVFDAVSIRTFVERFVDIVRVLRDLKYSHAVPTYVCTTMEESDTHFIRFRQDHYEGLMFRLDGHEYCVDKRVKHLLKRKAFLDHEFLIVDVEEGQGRCKGTLGALVCKTSDDKIFKVGTGFDDLTRKEFFLDPPIGQLATVQFLCYSDDEKPLNPSFQGLR